jgi:hypothetical protein
MPLKEVLSKWLKLFGGDTRRAIVGYIVVGLILAGGGLEILTKKVITTVIQIANTPSPLWATISLVLLCVLYTYLKAGHRNPSNPPSAEEALHEAFGVYWNSQYKLRCLRCKWPLKCASKGLDPSIFWCSNCNTKFALRDPDGNPLTEAKAILALKELLTTTSTRPDKALAG